MRTYIWTSILLLGTCAGSLTAQSRIYMSAKVGSTAVLPCDWRNISSTQLSSPHVEWRTFAETVFERKGGELYQGEEYENRVDVPEDRLLKGNCSLVLRNIRPDDAGVYESYLLVRRAKRGLHSRRVLIQSVELSVDDSPEEVHREMKAAPQVLMYVKGNAGTIQTTLQTFMFVLLPSIFLQII